MKAFTSPKRQVAAQKSSGLVSPSFGASARLHAGDLAPASQHTLDNQSGSQQDTEGKRTTSTGAETTRFRYSFADVSIHPTPAAANPSGEAASPATRSLGNYLSLPGPLASLAGTTVRPVADLAHHHQALAQASNGGIEIDASMVGAPAGEMQSLLAHEAVHVAQQKGAGHSASRNLLETEALQLSRHVLAGQPVWPALSGHSGLPLKQPPDKPKEPTEKELRDLDEAWKKAMGPKKTKLDHLKAQLRYLQQLRTLIRERQGIETQRTQLDMVDFGNANQAGFEGAGINMVNRKPVKTHVMPPVEEFPGDIELTVNFQARFLGRKAADAKADFQKLKTNLEAGISKVWGQTLGGMPSVARNYDFVVTPTIALVEETAPRDDNFWMIEVDPAITRAQTQALVDSGIMKIGSDDVNKPDTLGHESLHLFGLIDRYRDNPQTHHSESIRGTGKPGTGTGATRNDPLDTGKGPILTEDLEYVFARSGVYERILIANMTPYDMALIKQKGWGRVPRLVDLLDQADDQAAKAAKPPDPQGKPQPLSEREKSDPQRIIVQKINGLIMQVNADIDELALREHMLDLPDMAPSPAQKTH